MEELKSMANAAAQSLGPYTTRLLGALAIALVAWILGRLARTAARRLVQSARLEERLKTEGLGDLLGTIAYSLVWLFALPALLGTLGLDGLLVPVNAMMAKLMGFVPSLLGACVILAVGMLAARILRQLVSGLLTAAGSEKLAEKMGLTTALGEYTLAGIAGSIVFAFIMLPVVASASQTLGLDAVSKPVERLLEVVVDLIPKLLSAAIIVGIGVLLGRVLAGMVTALLAGMGFNRVPSKLGWAEDFKIGGRDACELAGGVAMFAIVLLSITQASEALGFKVLTDAVAQVGLVLANVGVAIVVMGVGLWLAQAAAAAIGSGSYANAKLLGALARGGILFFSGALALRETGLPADIISIAFASVVGALALGAALAFGVGGRDVAARLLNSAAQSFEKQPNKPDAATPDEQE